MTVGGICVAEVGSSCVEIIFSYVSTADCNEAARISFEVSIKVSFSSSTSTISDWFSIDSSGKLDESSEAIGFSVEEPRFVIVSLTLDAVCLIRSKIPCDSCSSVTDACNYNKKSEQFFI
jgi:hypothetical protein